MLKYYIYIKLENNMWDHLKIVIMRVTFKALKRGNLPPYLGSTVRGIMGHCIRDFECTEPDLKCIQCQKKDTCLYVKYFSNTGKDGGAINPYTIHVIKDGKTEWREGDECEFDLTLYGYAAEQPGIYLDAIISMQKCGWGAEKIPFQLNRIVNKQTNQLIYAQGKTWIRNLGNYEIKAEERDAKCVLVSFDTPLRIVKGKELCNLPTFSDLIRFICGRMSLISQVCGNQKIEWNEQAILEQSEKINIADSKLRFVDFKRYSINQKDNRLELPAVEGFIIYEGNLRYLVPILEAGKQFHVGKNATIGFGHYETYYDK